ncbi:MAG: RtcB family protein [Bacillota bacterium]
MSHVILSPDGPNRWLVPPEGAMRVPARIYLNQALYEQFREGDALTQLCDAASLPGVVGAALGMPDIHTGFGLPIGGVVATDADTGVVSAGAVGMDINCGVRLLAANALAADLTGDRLRRLVRAIEARIPTGIGRRTTCFSFTGRELERVLVNGAQRLGELGFAEPADLDCIEDYGRVPGADPDAVSTAAHNRLDQLATLGGGNHFIEIGSVDQIFDEATARAFGLVEGQLTIMIHSGSRGFGQQICVDYSKSMAEASPRLGVGLPSKGLAAVPIHSAEGQAYLSAMACAANYAFANRQLMTHAARAAYAEVLRGAHHAADLRLVYDITHNVAKLEEHDGRTLLVHRKGATRALAPGHAANPIYYRKTGHPVIVPGSMGTRSYVLVGTEAAEETFYTVNHGAGRALSRCSARQDISEAEFRNSIRGVLLSARNPQSLIDEAPSAYKDIDQVVDTMSEIKLVRKVAALNPLAVIKGEGNV